MLNDEQTTQRQKADKKTILKATAFFFVLFGAIMLSLMLKLLLNHDITATSVWTVFIPAALQITLLLAALIVYFLYTRTALVRSLKDLYAVGTAVAVAYIVNLFLSMLGVFAMPTMLAAFLIVPIGKRRDAFIGNLFCNFLILATLVSEYVYAVDGSVIFPTVYSLLDLIAMFVLGIAGGTIASYALCNKTGRFQYVTRGVMIAVANFAALVCIAVFQGLYRNAADFAVENFFESYLLPIIPFAAVSVFAPLFIGLLSQPVMERVFNLITDTRLMELTDHNSALIRRLGSEAPGTFNHSLAVAALAELCAAAIGENPYLARAAAYYHDVGKLENPQYYKENQQEINLHDELLPEVSADIIRAHTRDGQRLCDEYRIPKEVSHVTIQHHGTLLIAVFYDKAKKLTDSTIEPIVYSYQGQTPTTKVAAIIMLCDAAEAAIRAMGTPDGEKVDGLLSGLIESRISTGQFNNCDISMKDLTTIKNTIISAYGGLYHKRLKYPSGDK